MERKLPKNIRQIGNVSDNPKVYVEDYVDTFVNQLCEKAKEKPIGAFLIGETFRTDEQDYIFVHGAVLMEGLETKGNDVVLGDKTWKKACEEGKKYFAGNTIMGWILIAPGMQLKLNTNFTKLHERLFMKKSRMFIMKESLEKGEKFFIYKYNDLMEISGHYIYYEKNTSMQDYMIANRKQNCVSPSETYEDRATKDFRSVINKKEEKKKQNHKRYSYAVSVALVLVVAGLGVATLNEMNELEVVKSLLTEVIGGKGEDTQIASENIIETTESDVSVYIIEENSELDEAEVTSMDDAMSVDDVESVEVTLEEEVGLESEYIMETEENVDWEALGNSASSDSEIIAQGDTDATDWQEYIVVEGDTLDGISMMLCGTRAMVDEICALNELEDSDVIYVGQVLLLPQ